MTLEIFTINNYQQRHGPLLQFTTQESAEMYCYAYYIRTGYILTYSTELIDDIVDNKLNNMKKEEWEKIQANLVMDRLTN